MCREKLNELRFRVPKKIDHSRKKYSNVGFFEPLEAFPSSLQFQPVSIYALDYTHLYFLCLVYTVDSAYNIHGYEDQSVISAT